MQTIAGLLQPYRPKELGPKIGKQENRVTRWRSGESLPGPDVIPALAKALKMTTSELSEIIAAEKRARREARREPKPIARRKSA